MSHRFSSLLAATAATAVSIAAAACSKAPPPKSPRVPVVVATARRSAVPYTISTNGVVEPMQTAAVEAQVGGILTRVTFTEGQTVTAGQVLFQIDPRPYIAVLDQAKGQLARDQAQAANARRDAARYASLVEKDYVTHSQADQAAATAASSLATVETDRASVEHAQLDVSNSTIRAPISGRTGGLLVRQGNLVKANASTPMVVINQIQPILVRFSIPQSELPDIQRYFGAGKPLAVQASLSESAASAVSGTLAFVDNNVDSSTGTVLLKARFANPSATLWPGQFVTVALRLYVDPNALTVPSQAVLNGQQGTYVFTVDLAGNTKQQLVKVARTVDSMAVIASGLADGDRVITDGQSRLVTGSKVVIKPASTAGRKPVMSDSSANGGHDSGGGGNPGMTQ
ncbi:MAG: efflux RND transporter periplasmic adaptor subunit [Gemmatimonadota bacterium]|nr:efflux RND transporter periplasmic adaptor subunit [Gemmatimonadota bacterium]